MLIQKLINSHCVFAHIKNVRVSTHKFYSKEELKSYGNFFIFFLSNKLIVINIKFYLKSSSIDEKDLLIK